MNKSYEATILIPTYNRPQYLDKLLQYISNVIDQSKVRFIVLDGSEDGGLENQRICNKYNIEYHYYGSALTISERFLAGLELVETNLVSFLADDDFIDPQGYFKCIQFLQRNEEYSCAHGDYVDCSYHEGKIKFRYCYNMFSIEQSNPLDRLFCFLSNYQPIFYAVFRTKYLKTTFKEIVLNVEENDLVNFELLAGCIPVFLGKIKKIDSFYYVRQLTPNTPRKIIPDAKRVFIPSFSNRYTKIKKSLLQFVDNKDELVIDNAIDFCFASYYGDLCMNKQLVNYYYKSLKLSEANLRRPDYSIVDWLFTQIIKIYYFYKKRFFQIKKRLNIFQHIKIIKTIKSYFEEIK